MLLVNYISFPRLFFSISFAKKISLFFLCISCFPASIKYTVFRGGKIEIEINSQSHTSYMHLRSHSLLCDSVSSFLTYEMRRMYHCCLSPVAAKSEPQNVTHVQCHHLLLLSSFFIFFGFIFLWS